MNKKTPQCIAQRSIPLFLQYIYSSRKQHRCCFSSFYLCHIIVSILQSLLCLFRLRFVCSFLFDVFNKMHMCASSSFSSFDTLANRVAAFKVSTSNLSNSMIILIKSTTEQYNRNVLHVVVVLLFFWFLFLYIRLEFNVRFTNHSHLQLNTIFNWFEMKQSRSDSCILFSLLFSFYQLCVK